MRGVIIAAALVLAPAAHAEDLFSRVMVQDAKDKIAAGDRDGAATALYDAARWNDPEARLMLEKMGEAVPPPDLYQDSVVQREARKLTRDAEIQQRQAAQASWNEQFLYGMALGAVVQPRAGAVINVVPTNEPSATTYKCTSDRRRLTLQSGDPTYTCRAR